MTEIVAAFRRVLARGSSFPSLVETASGRLLVLKLSGAGQGSRGLATELIAGTLARLTGLNVPRALPVLLPAGLPWQVGTDEFYEAVQRSVGWNLGVEFVPDATDLEATDLATLPPEFLSRLAAADALLQNVDRTKANLNVLRDAAGGPWAIDFGACLLIDRLARGAVTPRLDLPGQPRAGRPRAARVVTAGARRRHRRRPPRQCASGGAGALVPRPGPPATGPHGSPEGIFPGGAPFLSGSGTRSRYRAGVILAKNGVSGILARRDGGNTCRTSRARSPG